MDPAKSSELKVLIKGNGVLVAIAQSCHDATLLVITNTLLKKVCLAPANKVDQQMCNL